MRSHSNPEDDRLAVDWHAVCGRHHHGDMTIAWYAFRHAHDDLALGERT